MLHKALRLMRIFYDLSQKDLAEKLGISKSYLSEIESGKKQPTLDLLNRYSSIFDIPLSSILFFSENLESDVKADKFKNFISSKVIAILNFIAERSAYDATVKE
ncbi:transcriptional regulator [Pseudanabaena sp. lw0831]|uniref:helix-turn-helix transcriptional regulator n=1 Tax=Pseudanabaena sp. lw0831 TaxID=1357935 RepID=UPI001915A69C|nr:helix-turn-helix transcriptional regulator [Pseudanabaena sp. lw0831]GBO51656.1 transcriptional regulator [Pseudanabaena sp. lw0831]